MKYIYTCLFIIMAVGLKAQTYVTFTYSEPALPAVFAGNDTIASLGETIILSPTITGGTAPIEYHWSPGHLLSDSTVMSPQYLVSEMNVDFTLTIVDSNGCTVSDMVNVSAPTGIKSVDEILIQVFPNPSKGNLIFKGFPLNESNVRITLFTMNGTRITSSILHIKNGIASLNIENISSGVYLAQFEIADRPLFQKIVIQ